MHFGILFISRREQYLSYVHIIFNITVQLD